MKRAAGVLLHPASLPSKFGIGDFGDEACSWISMLGAANQTYWQFLPIGPTGAGDSPYQSPCAFAGNPLFVSPVRLCQAGLLSQAELDAYPLMSEDRVDYAAVTREKEKLLWLAYSRFVKTPEFDAFCESEKYWLADFSLYCILKKQFAGTSWNSWDQPYKLRNADALARVSREHADEMGYIAFVQYMFFTQWKLLREHARAQGVQIIGDIPIYVALDSSDAWSAPHLFEFDNDCNPLRVAGVPPDYFAATGQLWGNPLYRWDVMKEDGYAWWIARIRKAIQFADIVRIDHFRAFESYWAIAAKSETAINGEWVKGPGMDFFSHLSASIGMLPLIAEDLGDITEAVDKLRNETGLPGMKVLQFAFDGNPENPHLPYNISSVNVVYTGTHDNDTTAGWLDTLSGVDRRRIDAYMGVDYPSDVDDIIRLAYASPAQTCIVPLQDILQLDSTHRMNIPGTPSGNWGWRCPAQLFRSEVFAKVNEMAKVYGRTK